MPLEPKLTEASPSGLSPASESLKDTPLWQKEMQAAFRNLDSLLKYLQLDPNQAPWPISGKADFPLLVPKGFAARMIKGSWDDPLLLQVFPQSQENKLSVGFINDAVGDLASQIIPGLLHKYSSRALLMVSHQCAIHCRYCFRREFPYGDLPRGQAGWDEAWAYLEGAPEIDEIVLSGGDPMFLDNRKLERILEKATTLANIHTIRFHTRLPIVLPSRIEAGLLSLLRSVADRKNLVVVVHVNHPNELDRDSEQALQAIRNAGAMLLNQTVLLRNINDTEDVLVKLSQRLLACGTLPYYLHQLDKVTGTAHFEVPETRGRALIEGMRKKLPGYAIPRYVRETAGEPYKTPLSG